MDEAKEIDPAPIFWQHQVGTDAGELMGATRSLKMLLNALPFVANWTACRRSTPACYANTANSKRNS